MPKLEPRDRDRGPAPGREPLMDQLDRRRRGQVGAAVEQAHAVRRRLRGERAVTGAVRHQEPAQAAADRHLPRVARHNLARIGHGDGADLKRRRPPGRPPGSPQPRHRHGAAIGPGEDADMGRHALDGAQPAAGAARRRIAVGKAAREIAHARSRIDREQLDAVPVGIVIGRDGERALAGMLDDVAGQLGRDQRDIAGRGVVELGRSRDVAGVSARRPDILRLGERQDHAISNA